MASDHTDNTARLKSLMSRIASAKEKTQRDTPSPAGSAPSGTAPTGMAKVDAPTPKRADPLEDWTSRITTALGSMALPSEVLRLYFSATKDLSTERYRKNDLFGHLWVCYARMLQQTGSNGDDVRDTYKFMKTERIAQQLPYYYTARAEFESSEGNTSKCRDILAQGKSCPPAVQSAQTQEELFQAYLLGIKEIEDNTAKDAAPAAVSTGRTVSAVEEVAKPQGQVPQVLQTPKMNPAPRKRFGVTSTGKKTNVGLPRRVLKQSSAPTIGEGAPPTLTESTTEDTTQVHFGKVSTSEIRAQQKTTSKTPKTEAPTLIRARDTSAPQEHPFVSPPPKSATKRQRVVPVAADEEETGPTIVTFKPKSRGQLQPSSARGLSPPEEATESTIVSFKSSTAVPPTPQSQPTAVFPETPATAPTVIATASTPMEYARPAPARASGPQSQERESVCVDGVWYQKLSQIGKGGSSKVYKVISPKHEIYALKEIDLASADEAALKGYENEIELLQTLQGSPHIIAMIGWERKADPAILYIVMECGDADLSTALKNRKSIANTIDENYQRLHWQHMLEAVQAIHALAIVHSDLKPANFLFVGGVLKLIDFGIATRVEEDHTSALRDTAVGTLNYMAPEAISSQAALPVRGAAKQVLKITPAADVWSLGCILYSLAFGKTPFQHLNPLQKLQAIVSPDFKIDYPATKNRALIDVLQKCLVRDPKKRPTIAQLLAHRFLNPQSAAQTPVKKAAPGKVLQISQEQLETLLREQALSGGIDSPGTVSRRVMRSLSGNGSQPTPVRPSRLRQANTRPQQEVPQKPRAAFTMLDPNALKQGKGALKQTQKPKQAPRREVGTDIASIIQQRLQNKFKDSAPQDADTAHTDTTEWPTMQTLT